MTVDKKILSGTSLILGAAFFFSSIQTASAYGENRVQGRLQDIALRIGELFQLSVAEIYRNPLWIISIVLVLLLLFFGIKSRYSLPRSDRRTGLTVKQASPLVGSPYPDQGDIRLALNNDSPVDSIGAPAHDEDVPNSPIDSRLRGAATVSPPDHSALQSPLSPQERRQTSTAPSEPLYQETPIEMPKDSMSALEESTPTENHAAAKRGGAMYDEAQQRFSPDVGNSGLGTLLDIVLYMSSAIMVGMALVYYRGTPYHVLLATVSLTGLSALILWRSASGKGMPLLLKLSLVLLIGITPGLVYSEGGASSLQALFDPCSQRLAGAIDSARGT